MKRLLLFILLLTSIMLIISCKQTVKDGEIRRDYDFNLSKTIRVLQRALKDENVTEESDVIDVMYLVGIRGATKARLVDEPERELFLEIVCEDNKTYEFSVDRSFYDSGDETGYFYFVEAVQDMQTGEYIYAIYGRGETSPSTWAEKGPREPVEFDVESTQEVLRSVLVDNEPDGYDIEEFWTILRFMRTLGIPGATHAVLYEDSEHAERRSLEIVSEDGKNYRFDLTRIDFNPTGIQYTVRNVIDLDTGEVLWHEIDGIVY